MTEAWPHAGNQRAATAAKSDFPPDESGARRPAARDSAASAAAPAPAGQFGTLALPSISMPKGGGAISGIGEKLTIGQATGTASLSVPVFTSPGRSGFGPALSLTYDSGGGNGPFGLGWRLSVPSVTRKTSMGLPRYEDAADSDVFIVSAVEDLVPLLKQTAVGWVPDVGPDPSNTYTIRRYRPRAEADFSRIERWDDAATGETHWRTISRDNLTSLFGQTPASRVADPADPARVFSWLLDCSFDARGNVVAYDYQAEDSARVPAAVSEAGRTVTANRYLKRIRYGNTTPYRPAVDPALPAAWHFEVLLDYGDLDEANPLTSVPGGWPCRSDPFSTYRAGFEVRTYRLCRRVLMFHLFPDQLGADPVLVRSTDLSYTTDAPGNPALPVYSLLTSVTQRGYLSGAQPGQLPPVTFGYSPVAVHDEVHVADPEALENLPAGVDGQRWRWADLDGEGLQGVLTDDDGAWYYKRNISAWTPDSAPPRPRFEPLAAVAAKPVLSLGRTAQLADLHGDGRLCAVVYAPPVAGYYERDGAGGWLPFTAFRSTAGIDWADPNLRSVDLDGDGLADVLVADQPCFTWYPWLAEDGFGPGLRTLAGYDEDAGPAVVFADGEASVYLADMSGDGLSDLVRVRNGEVCYWPNLGYGRFGPKITMDGAPWFERQDLFDERRIRLADLDGTGTADLVYLGPGQVTIWFNQSGNSWTQRTTLISAPAGDELTTVTPVDLLGAGTTCLAWSSPLPGDSGRQLRYIDLMGGIKPHLLTSVVNNMGAETTLEYAPSTRFYVADRYAGRPWATRLPFPVHVVTTVTTVDRVSRTRLATSYSYHHGFFESTEREFRGFGMVEQTDADFAPAASGTGTFTGTPPETGGDFALPPVRTRTWFHTGAYVGGTDIAAILAGEYYQGDPQAVPLDGTLFTGFPAVPDPPAAEEMREACRALRGRVLRSEVYADDGSPQAGTPYACTEHRYQVTCLQPPSAGSYGGFYASELESLGYHYERDASDPRCAHDLTLEIDPYGTVTKSASVGYPRRTPAFPQQGRTPITYTEHDVANVTDQPGWYRVGVPVETRQFELTGFTPSGALFAPDKLLAQVETAPTVPYETAPPPGPCRRLMARERTYYLADDLTGLPLGQVGATALVDRGYTMTMTPGLISGAYRPKSTPADITSLATNGTSAGGGYTDLDGDGSLWAPSARLCYSPDPAHPDAAFARLHFYLPQGSTDQFGGQAAIGWENDLVVVTATDPVQNTTTAQVNYRVLQPWLITDPNQNRTGARYDQLGLVTAVAVMGKNLGGGADEGDHLDLSTAEAAPGDDPTTTFDYDRSAYQAWASGPAPDPDHPAPTWSHSRARVRHKDPATPWLESYTYTDGTGRAALVKAQAEPGEAPERDAQGNLVYAADGSLVFGPTQTRWVGSGRVVYDNKGNPVKAYEPFFDSSPVYDDESDLVEWGVTAVTRYDPLSRPVRVDKPDGSYTSVQFGPWRRLDFDENDNVLSSAWYAARRSGGLGADQQDAAAKATAHANTPAISDFDALGRVFRTVADNAADGQYQTLLDLDISGRVVATTDALARVIMATTYAMSGSIIAAVGADSGHRWLLPAADGSPLRSWDDRDHAIAHSYDAARRLTGVSVSTAGATAVLAERLVYGEGQGGDAASNLRGSVYQAFSGAGVATTVSKDFAGNVVQASQELLADVAADAPADWSAAPTLDPATLLTASTGYDALNRVTETTTPDGSVTAFTWGERSLLAAVTLTLPGGTATDYVTAVSYDPKGQRQSVSYGNLAVTTYTYEPETFRLIQLVTTRPASAGPGPLQQLSYTYDPVGNITRIADAAQPTVFFSNQLVAPAGDYTYDAIYRLTIANGREHLGQAPDAPTGSDDTPFQSPALPSDATAMRNYKEYFFYDHVGNITSVQHVAAGGGWTRTYHYATIATDNRLSSTQVGSLTEAYGYDPHGNMTSMFGLPLLGWDCKDQLQTTSRSSGSGPQPATWYRYDQAGKRVRKISVSAAGVPQSERIYFGGYEVYRAYDGTGALTLERQTVIVPDGAKHLALVETSYDKTNPAAKPVTAVRYQFSNHLGSACLEVDDQAAVITYEEYFPYGMTSFIAGTSAAEVSLKRYRYTGKERDTENGLHYFGARFYASWVGRWISCDPLIKDVSRTRNDHREKPLILGGSYEYVRGNPNTYIDYEGMAPTPAQLAQDIQEHSNELLKALQSSKALFRGTYESTLAEAQGAEFLKPSGVPFNHIQSLKDGTAQIRNQLSEISESMTELNDTAPRAAASLGDALRPALDKARAAVNLAQRTLQIAADLTKRGYGQRLSGALVEALERSEKSMASEQLKKLGEELLPQEIAEAPAVQETLEEIEDLPITADEVEEVGRQTAMAVAGAITAITATKGGAAAAAGSAVRAFFGTAMELIETIGSRLSVPVIFITPVGFEKEEKYPRA